MNIVTANPNSLNFAGFSIWHSRSVAVKNYICFFGCLSGLYLVLLVVDIMLLVVDFAISPFVG